MRSVGNYQIKPYTKSRRNIEIITREGWKKRSVHAVLELDVTVARQKIKNLKNKSGSDISFTGWIIKCVGQAITEHKDLNAYRHGKRKIFVFDDIDIAIPIERMINNESRPMAYIIRKVNEKDLSRITKEIRTAQDQKLNNQTQVLGEKITFLERFALNAPSFLQKLLLIFAKRNAKLKKKHMGTIGVTAIGMKGRFPGWVIPLGGTVSTLFVVGGITKKPGAFNNKIEIREFLHLTISTDHDIVDGGPLARFIARFSQLIETGYFL